MVYLGVLLVIILLVHSMAMDINPLVDHLGTIGNGISHQDDGGRRELQRLGENIFQHQTTPSCDCSDNLRRDRRQLEMGIEDTNKPCTCPTSGRTDTGDANKGKSPKKKKASDQPTGYETIGIDENTTDSSGFDFEDDDDDSDSNSTESMSGKASKTSKKSKSSKSTKTSKESKTSAIPKEKGENPVIETNATETIVASSFLGTKGFGENGIDPEVSLFLLVCLFISLAITASLAMLYVLIRKENRKAASFVEISLEESKHMKPSDEHEVFGNDDRFVDEYASRPSVRAITQRF